MTTETSESPLPSSSVALRIHPTVAEREVIDGIPTSPPHPCGAQRTEAGLWALRLCASKKRYAQELSTKTPKQPTQSASRPHTSKSSNLSYLYNTMAFTCGAGLPKQHPSGVWAGPVWCKALFDVPSPKILLPRDLIGEDGRRLNRRPRLQRYAPPWRYNPPPKRSRHRRQVTPEAGRQSSH